MSDTNKKEEKFVVKISCELDEDILKIITNQIYERFLDNFANEFKSVSRKV